MPSPATQSARTARRTSATKVAMRTAARVTAVKVQVIIIGAPQRLRHPVYLRCDSQEHLIAIAQLPHRSPFFALFCRDVAAAKARHQVRRLEHGAFVLPGVHKRL